MHLIITVASMSAVPVCVCALCVREELRRCSCVHACASVGGADAAHVCVYGGPHFPSGHLFHGLIQKVEFRRIPDN